MNAPRFRIFSIADYDAVLHLWRASEGVGLNESDSKDAIQRFLIRNPDLSLVVEDGGEIIGAVLCGHDGRRGYLHHLAGAKPHQRRGIARALVKQCLASLHALDIPKCNVFLYSHNLAGRVFWSRAGWKARDDLVVVQTATAGSNEMKA